MTALELLLVATVSCTPPPPIMHEYGGPFVVACGDPADPGVCIAQTWEDALRARDWTCGGQGR